MQQLKQAVQTKKSFWRLHQKKKNGANGNGKRQKFAVAAQSFDDFEIEQLVVKAVSAVPSACKFYLSCDS